VASFPVLFGYSTKKKQDQIVVEEEMWRMFVFTFDLGSHFLQMLNDGTLDGLAEIGVLLPAIHLSQGTDSQT
jgi:hypothetical protein